MLKYNHEASCLTFGTTPTLPRPRPLNLSNCLLYSNPCSRATCIQAAMSSPAASATDPLFIGNTAGNILVGVVLYQAVYYFFSNKDRWPLQTMPHHKIEPHRQIRISAFTVACFTTNSIHSNEATFITTNWLTGVIVFLSHMFFVRSLRLVDAKRWWIWGLVTLLSVLCVDPKFKQEGFNGHVWILMTINITAALADLLVTFAFSRHLHSANFSFSELFKNLLVYSITRGAVSNLANVYCITTSECKIAIHLRDVRDNSVVDSAVQVAGSGGSLQFARQRQSSQAVDIELRNLTPHPPRKSTPHSLPSQPPHPSLSTSRRSSPKDHRDHQHQEQGDCMAIFFVS
ncbi:hypothetical protein DL96DRAFT_1600445 [Flagelloscypha sp. PMI_526]|nr:hypothetical protein DL96DRAFT_1600445 [Flagelloscypha sp. PMI_526]